MSWYPDGSALLVVGRTTFGVGHSELLRQPLDGSAPVRVSAALDRNVLPGGPGYPGALPQFHGDDIVFCARDRGVTRLYRVDAAGISASPLPMRHRGQRLLGRPEGRTGGGRGLRRGTLRRGRAARPR